MQFLRKDLELSRSRKNERNNKCQKSDREDLQKDKLRNRSKEIKLNETKFSKDLLIKERSSVKEMTLAEKNHDQLQIRSDVELEKLTSRRSTRMTRTPGTRRWR